MPSKVALVASLLCCITQVELTPRALISKTKSSGVVSSLHVEIVVKQISSGNIPDPEEGDDDKYFPALSVNLTAPGKQGLFAKWAPEANFSGNISGYQVTLSEVGGAVHTVNTTEKTSFIFPGLKVSTAYQVNVQLLDDGGQTVGTAATAEQTTLSGTSAGGCPFPELLITNDADSMVGCAWVTKTTGRSQVGEIVDCQNAKSNPIIGGLYYYHPNILRPFKELQDYLRLLDYTDEMLLAPVYSVDKWLWDDNGEETTPIDVSLLTGVPAGGVGPNDYTMLYIDPAKNYGLSAAKNGHVFGGKVCFYGYNK